MHSLISISSLFYFWHKGAIEAVTEGSEKMAKIDQNIKGPKSSTDVSLNEAQELVTFNIFYKLLAQLHFLIQWIKMMGI